MTHRWHWCLQCSKIQNLKKSPGEWKGSVYVISFRVPSFYEVSSRALFLVTTRFFPFALAVGAASKGKKTEAPSTSQQQTIPSLSQSVGEASTCCTYNSRSRVQPSFFSVTNKCFSFSITRLKTIVTKCWPPVESWRIVHIDIRKKGKMLKNGVWQHSPKLLKRSDCPTQW